MEFHGAFGHVELRRNFLVSQTLQDAIQHFLLAAADLHTRSEGASGGKQFLRPLGGGIQKRFPGYNQHFIVFRCLTAYETVNGKQTGDFLHRHAAIGFGIDAKARRTRGAFAYNETLWQELGALIECFRGLLSSVYQCWPHSFQSKLGIRTNFGIL